ncbi:chlorophyll synthesis pathway protein BchC [Tranquillimonas alkanivorans]|uniref:3-hydroxyethyl bacteriochlorophyllide a dehydrogenase n=1 Tax=Tranquillimonas alkanivorans TaxID=441119 RepID=A0A1I5LE27_9RHOB|nr:chlorophyll synthesis pathway protein BchC [Tranquillimonas alkanivorans]SFO95619.1 3-hydroxyethyl bacteriochlorophyllide a dehydrogenase [Tranquillimonas alkanivorans]
MQTTAIILKAPSDLALDALRLTPPGAEDVVVETAYSGISSGTERLFWSGTMPPFPGMGYPLVPGYETVGEVVEAGRESGLRPGDHVFVPGADCYDGARGLFGGAASRLLTAGGRVTKIDSGHGERGALLALAATAHHAIAGHALPELIVGHGTLGRLLARLTVAKGAPPPTVWETNAVRRTGGGAYPVIAPEDDARRDYAAICDASGDAGLLDTLIGRIARGGEVVLSGFYPQAISFAFPTAFLKEARLRVAAEWAPEDLRAVRDLVERGALSLAGLVSHRRPAGQAEEAYRTAFTDPDCLKMILDWKGHA